MLVIYFVLIGIICSIIICTVIVASQEGQKAK